MIAQILAAQTAPDATGLTAGGIVIMTLSISLVLGLLSFCMYRILREPTPAEHHHAPLDIDTHDRNGSS